MGALSIRYELCRQGRVEVYNRFNNFGVIVKRGENFIFRRAFLLGVLFAGSWAKASSQECRAHLALITLQQYLRGRDCAHEDCALVQGGSDFRIRVYVRDEKAAEKVPAYSKGVPVEVALLKIDAGASVARKHLLEQSKSLKDYLSKMHRPPLKDFDVRPSTDLKDPKGLEVVIDDEQANYVMARWAGLPVKVVVKGPYKARSPLFSEVGKDIRDFREHIKDLPMKIISFSPVLTDSGSDLVEHYEIGVAEEWQAELIPAIWKDVPVKVLVQQKDSGAEITAKRAALAVPTLQKYLIQHFVSTSPHVAFDENDGQCFLELVLPDTKSAEIVPAMWDGVPIRVVIEKK